MGKIVFDSSAVLTLIKMEDGYEKVAERLDDAIISSVNFCEILVVVSRKGFKQEQTIENLKATFRHIVDFDKEQATIAATLDSSTKGYGLSLGDRACLALAKHKNLPVLTADKVWKKLKVGVDIQLVR